MPPTKGGRWRRRADKRRFVWALLPIVALLVDVVCSPHLFHTWQAPPVTVAELEKTGELPIGRVRNHELFVSLDDLESPRYLARARANGASIIVSVFYSKEEREKLLGGRLYSGVKAHLSKVDPALAAKYDKKLDAERDKNAVEDCVAFNVPLDAGQRARTSLRRIYTVFLAEESDQKQTPAVIQKALLNCFDLVEDDPVVVLHAVGVNSGAVHPFRIGTLFEKAFASLLEAEAPVRLSFSLYEQWDDAHLTHVLSQLREEHEKLVAGGFSPRLTHGRLRSFLVLLAICLVFTTSRVVLRPLGFLTVTGFYYGLWWGASEAIDVLASEYSADFRFVLHGAVSLVTAALIQPLATKVPAEVLFTEGEAQ